VSLTALKQIESPLVMMMMMMMYVRFCWRKNERWTARRRQGWCNKQISHRISSGLLVNPFHWLTVTVTPQHV